MDDESIGLGGAKTEPETAGTCATCGRPLTQCGPNGECLRCLVNLGFLADGEHAEKPAARGRLTPGPLRYAHFEVETGADGFPLELGAGAMAITYRARDTVLNSVIALKVIDRKVAENPGARTRFLREARAAANIRHPNVAQVTFYGEQDGECFYAMELVEGETLEARVRRDGPMPLALALQVIEQAARALAVAEVCGVVHRDIKPSNLMLESDASETLMVKVIDYGVAKVMGPQAEPGAEQTQAGFIGTPAFASPEQFAGAGQSRIDTHSDIYSIGVTLWYLLSGRTPFVGRTMEEIRTRQTSELPLEQLRNLHLPGQVITLLKSMLAPDPKDRPQSARDLLAAVHSCYTRFNPEARSRRRRAVLAGAALTLVIAAIALGTWMYQRTRPFTPMERSIAVLPFENLSSDKENAYFAEGIQDEILTRLSKIADLKVISRTSTQKYNSAPDNLREVGSQLGVANILEGSVQKIANAAHINVQLIRATTDEHVWAESYNRTLDDVFSVEGEVATAIAEQLNAKLTGAEHKEITDKPTNNPVAYDAYLRGVAIEHNEYGYESYQNAVTAYAQAVQLDPKFALAWARLAVLRSFLFFNTIDRNVNTPPAVQEAADRAMALAPEAGESWVAKGAYHYRVLRDFEGAVTAYQEAQRRLPNNAFLLQNLAFVLRRVGRWQDAETNYNKALELDPRDVSLLSSLGGEFYGYLRRFDDARAVVDRALEISPDSETAHAIKASILQNEGRLPEAAQELARVPEGSTEDYVVASRITQATYERGFDRAIRVIEQKLNSIPPGQQLDAITQIALVQLGFCQDWSGRHVDAQQSFTRAIQSIKPTPDTVVAPEANGLPNALALAYAGLGEKQKALEQAQQAVKDYETDAVNKPTAMMTRAQVQALFGDHDAAIAVLPELLRVPAGLTVANLKFDPFWDPLRNDPRFQKLCHQ